MLGLGGLTKTLVGFGVGLAGIRFDPAPLAIYLAAAAFAGFVFHFSETRCLRRNYPSTP